LLSIIYIYGLLKGFPDISTLWDKKMLQKRAVKLAELLLAEPDQYETCMGTNHGDKPPDLSSFRKDMDHDDKPEDIHSSSTISSSESPLLSAARHGIIEIVDMILTKYPEAIEAINERDENIFHVAVRYRKQKILDLLQKWPAPTTRLRRRFNCDGDSILHQAAYLRERQLRDRPGEALRMQSEMQWFEVGPYCDFIFG